MSQWALIDPTQQSSVCYWSGWWPVQLVTADPIKEWYTDLCRGFSCRGFNPDIVSWNRRVCNQWWKEKERKLTKACKFNRGSRFNPVLDMLASFKKGSIGGVKVHVDRLQVCESSSWNHLVILCLWNINTKLTLELVWNNLTINSEVTQLFLIEKEAQKWVLCSY